MHPIHPERGVTLIELVLAIVIVGIIVAAIAFFINPLRQGTDIALRAELTDIADNALQRIGRDVKLALPNSVRTATAGTSRYLEFIAVTTAGRYRADGGGPAGGANCDNDDTTLVAPDNDQLSFDLPAGDRCFKTLGKVPGAITAGTDQLVLNNYGFPDQDAYQTAGTLNRVLISAVDTGEAGRDRISFAATTFVRALHDSPGKRFFVISGPVTYECDLAGGRILRHSGYGLAAAQPVVFGGTPVLVAEHVAACVFEYAPSVSAQLGLLTLRLQLQRQLFGGTAETVSLYHAVHVNNAP
ncbi:MAG: type II secretion system protein [Burkholderiales bacterium]